MRLPLFPACNATALCLTLAAGPALAEVPRVVTDIPPVASLAAMVLGDLGTPEVLVTPGASAHGASLKPSQARALEAADVVVWIGPELTPGIARQIEALAEGAQRLTLADLPETRVLPFRDGGLEPHDHGEDDDHGHADEEHDDHTEDDHAGDDHADDDHAGAMHEEDIHLDPHLWHVHRRTPCVGLMPQDPAPPLSVSGFLVVDYTLDSVYSRLMGTKSDK